MTNGLQGPEKCHPAFRWQAISVKNVHYCAVVKTHNKALSLTRRHRKLNSKLSGIALNVPFDNREEF
ncbi:hypothetical protein VTN00DRAFT_1998 [Thermoascus crustaceus]|uniref:uncharacterized protein n=1 Tax=Thermoascus crustaceus TaxID=5088 RepID=UPI003743E01B